MRLLRSIPFTLDYNPSRGISFIQNLAGSGWHEILPERAPSFAFPELSYHTAVSFDNGRSGLVFGGTCGNNDSNDVFIVTLSAPDHRTYTSRLQHCGGDIPPPMQGHAACTVNDKMYVYGGVQYNSVTECNIPVRDVYVLDTKAWTWTKLSSVANTAPSHHPEEAVFGSLTPLDDSSLLLVGGRRLVPFKRHKNGMVSYRDKSASITSQNMHVFSIVEQKWSKVECEGVVPRVWGHTVHSMSQRKLILFGGNYETEPVNTVYVLDARKKVFKWTEVTPQMHGVPPSLSTYRAAIYLHIHKKLLVFGGYYQRREISNDVLRPTNSFGAEKHDGKSTQVYDPEIYSFDLKSRQWSRLRVPRANIRMGHSIVELSSTTPGSSSTLVCLGGCWACELGETGSVEGRKYCKDVLRFDLDF